MANPKATIETGFGTIEIELLPDVAPRHVENFQKLAQDGFYNGTIFHRIIPGFVIQGGDPNSRDDDRTKHGLGGPGYKIDAEFSNRSHERGTVAMARGADPNSAGSQFFINIVDNPHLNGQYTLFGKVTAGMDVVDKIAAQPRDRRDNPIERIEMTVGVQA